MKRVILLFILLPMQLMASESQLREIVSLMRFDELIEVVRLEGLADSEQLPEQMMLGQGGSAWQEQLTHIYNSQSMRDTVTEAFSEKLGQEDLGGILRFISSDAWQEAIDLEVAGRIALLDPDVEEAAFEAYYRIEAENTRRLQDLRELVEVANLVDDNVAGVMNGIYRFNLGLQAGGINMGYTDDEMLSQIWAEERTIRGEVSDWMYSFLLLAYDPMETGSLRKQIEFFKTSDGKCLNRAIFESFEVVLDDIAFQMGFSVAELMKEQLL